MVAIRLATAEDAAAIRAIYAPCVRDTAISFEVEPPSLSEMRRRIIDTLARWPWLVCQDERGVRGYAYATAHRARAAYQWSVEVSAYVESSARRSGVGTGLYVSLVGILALQGFYNAYAGITLPNPASVALHERMGFQPVGIYRHIGFKSGKWHDVGWWALSLQPRVPAPEPPHDLNAVRGSPHWDRAIAAGVPRVRS